MGAFIGVPTPPLTNLPDVSIVSPTNGQVLTWNAADSKWENMTPAAAGVALLGKASASAPTPSLTVSSIPGSYTALQIIVYGQSTLASNTGMQLQFNGDAGSNYDTQFVQGLGSNSPTSGESIGATSASAGSFGLSTLTRPGVSNITIPGYTSLASDKIGTGTSAISFATGSTGNIIQMREIVWRPATPAAITSVTASIASGNINTGGFLAVYGLP